MKLLLKALTKLQTYSNVVKNTSNPNLMLVKGLSSYEKTALKGAIKARNYMCTGTLGELLTGNTANMILENIDDIARLAFS